MREILFKAKRVDNGEWVEGSYVYTFGNNPLRPITNIVSDYYFIVAKNKGVFEIDKNTICQYTGLTDKNGNKIWENDIVQSSEGCLDCDNGIGNIDFYSGLWYVNGNVQNSLYDLIYIGEHEIEIIGNVFDNPELLEVK